MEDVRDGDDRAMFTGIDQNAVATGLEWNNRTSILMKFMATESTNEMFLFPLALKRIIWFIRSGDGFSINKLKSILFLNWFRVSVWNDAGSMECPGVQHKLRQRSSQAAAQIETLEQ